MFIAAGREGSRQAPLGAAWFGVARSMSPLQIHPMPPLRGLAGIVGRWHYKHGVPNGTIPADGSREPEKFTVPFAFVRA